MVASSTAITQHGLDHFARAWCLPLMLLLNFACLQYLILLFRRRRRELRVLLLLGVAALSVVALIPFATQDDATMGRMNDLSESCLALLLLVQTALVGSKTQSKGGAVRASGSSSTKAISLVTKSLQLTADLLIAFDLVVVALGVISVFSPSVASEFGGAQVMNNVSENLTLAFTFVYRFVGLALSKSGSWRAVLREDNWELFWHVVFATHEYVFALVEHETHLSYEFVQAVYMRLTIVPCVWMTMGDHHEFHIVRATLRKSSGQRTIKEEAVAPHQTKSRPPKANEVVDAGEVTLSELNNITSTTTDIAPETAVCTETQS